MKEILNWSENGSGLMASGGSMGNLLGLAVARNQKSYQIKMKGLSEAFKLRLYCSTETHNSIQKSIELLGLGSENICFIPADSNYRILMNDLRDAVKNDLRNGYVPFCVVGNAGTVGTGAIDPLDEIADFCAKEDLWFHVDGAIGAVANLVDEVKPFLKGMEKADSLSLDMHKWLYIQYEAGCVLFKDPVKHKEAFQIQANYLLKHDRGLAAGPEPLSQLDPFLSRGFKALKVWMNIKEHGLNKFQLLIRQNIAQAFYLESLIKALDELEVMAPVSLNIVCFRFKGRGMDEGSLNRLNREILMTLHEKGIAIPTYTFLGGKYVLRVAITNHRSKKQDFEVLVNEVVRLGRALKEGIKNFI